MNRKESFDDSKLEMSKKIYYHALDVTNDDVSLALGLMMKIIATSCASNENSIAAFADVHRLFDEYEEIENRLGIDDSD